MVRFTFQNSNGVFYHIAIDKTTGAGKAWKVGLTNKNLMYSTLTPVTVTVDTASLTAWQRYHPSRRIHAAVYNTTTALNSILNASS